MNDLEMQPPRWSEPGGSREKEGDFLSLWSKVWIAGERIFLAWRWLSEEEDDSIDLIDGQKLNRFVSQGHMSVTVLDDPGSPPPLLPSTRSLCACCKYSIQKVVRSGLERWMGNAS